MSINNKKHNQIKITTKPTKSGYILIFIIISMLIASINYGNNMAYMFTFFILSFLLISFIYTKNNLRNIDISNLRYESVFAGSKLKISLELTNLSTKNKFGIWIKDSKNTEISGPFSINLQSNVSVSFSIPTQKRGQFTINNITILSIFPLAVFLVEKKIECSKSYLVYPRPRGEHAWIEENLNSNGLDYGMSFKGGDDFSGLKPYRIGESMHHIDWKSFARGRALNVKEFSSGSDSILFFDFEKLNNLSIESRLSQLCRWILSADKLGIEYGLKLPELKICPDSNPIHTLRCLESLAKF